MNRRDSDKEGGHETKSQNTDAQRVPATTAGLCVLVGLRRHFVAVVLFIGIQE